MHVWALGLSCETPAGLGPPGLHTTTRELQTCTFDGPGASNTTKKPREDPQRETKRAKIVAGDGKKARNFGPATLAGPHLALPHPLEHHHDTPDPKLDRPNLDWPKLDWPKLALAKIGRAKTTMAKTGLAKVGLFRCHGCTL